MAPHSSTPAWKIPWTEEPSRLQSIGSLSVGHNCATSLSLFTFMHWRRKWQPTPVFVPGEITGTGGLPSLGSHRVGHDWSDLAAAESYSILYYLNIKSLNFQGRQLPCKSREYYTWIWHFTKSCSPFWRITSLMGVIWVTDWHLAYLSVYTCSCHSQWLICKCKYLTTYAVILCTYIEKYSFYSKSISKFPFYLINRALCWFLRKKLAYIIYEFLSGE